MSTKLWRSIDSVVMLTWSDWKTEPRSNRYHFATRFARHVPVFFVQPDSIWRKVWLEKAGPNITIVHAPITYGIDEAQGLASALYEAGCRKPMLWIYNVLFEAYIRRSNAVLRIMHATEDYFTQPKGWAVADQSISEPLIRTLEHLDLLVAVSTGVLNSYTAERRYTGPTLLLENGCDSKFWYETRAFDYQPTKEGRPVALFQGGINKRLDFLLLVGLARCLPSWEFWFCGKVGFRSDGWTELRRLPNVRYFGVQTVDGVASLARKANVGLIPFQQDELIRRSLPLKAYEYVACGMPVVSVPIDALANRSHLFCFASNVEEFASALEQLQSTRSDPSAVDCRLVAAAAASYDQRFDLLVQALTSHLELPQNRNTLRYTNPEPAIDPLGRYKKLRIRTLATLKHLAVKVPGLRRTVRAVKRLLINGNVT